MGFVPFEHTVVAELRFLYSGQRVENVLHFKFPAEVTAENQGELGIALVDWWDGMRPYIPTTCSLEEVAIKDLTTDLSPGISYVGGLPLAGTNVGPQLPNHVTFAVSWHTAFTGRSYRGRTYHVGLVESQVTGNTLESVFRGEMVSAYNGLIPVGVGVGAQLVIASRISGGVERFSGLSTPVTACTIDPTVDSQRRRLPGRGS